MAAAAAALRARFGPRPEVPIATAWSPGRCTIVGEHVDYAGGLVLACAVDLGVGIAVRASPDGPWRAVSGQRAVERSSPLPAGDIGDRIFAAALALARGGAATPVEVGVAAGLPEAAGLASSAAIVCATVTALLRLRGLRVSRDQVETVALRAERDIAGVPCGALDQRAIVRGFADGALLLDFANGAVDRLAWPWPDLVLVACSSGEQHDVGGAAYRSRRDQCEEALRRLGVSNCQQIDAESEAVARLPAPLPRRVRHLVSETQRSRLAAGALRDRDAALLGQLMTAGHRSLVSDFETGTARTDTLVAAALDVDGVLGARMVGAGFGGTVVALCAKRSGDRCRSAMSAAAGRQPSCGWVLAPSAGLGDLAPDAVI